MTSKHPALQAERYDKPGSPKDAQIRIKAMQHGETQFGCAGAHSGYGAPGCPKWLHHHHDARCWKPSDAEIRAAGLDPETITFTSRA